jgi:hypothetical protein
LVSISAACAVLLRFVVIDDTKVQQVAWLAKDKKRNLLNKKHIGKRNKKKQKTL